MELRKIQHDIVEVINSTKLVCAVRDGSITKEQYTAYLCDVYSYALHSSQVIGLAGARLVSKNPELAEYLFAHAAEELGHDRWVASDLRDLGLSDDDISGVRPSSVCRRMIALEYFYATYDNPVGLFGWMFALESLGGKIGGGIARALDAALHLNGKAVYFLRGHGEADAHHSEDLCRIISENLRAVENYVVFAEMVVESRDLYCGILDSAWRAQSVRTA